MVAHRVPATAKEAPAKTRNQATLPAKGDGPRRAARRFGGASATGTAAVGIGAPDQRPHPAAQRRHRRVQERLAVQADDRQLLGGVLAQQHGEDAVPGADDAAEQPGPCRCPPPASMPPASSPTIWTACKSSRWRTFSQQLVRGLAGGRHQDPCEQVPQAIEQSLRQDQADEDPSPGGLLPARAARRRRVVQLRRRRGRPAPRAGARRLVDVTATRTNHGHGFVTCRYGGRRGRRAQAEWDTSRPSRCPEAGLLPARGGGERSGLVNYSSSFPRARPLALKETRP